MSDEEHEPPLSAPMVRWLIMRFTTREAYIRFLATVIMVFTAHFMWRDKPIPDGWWGLVGVVMGYFFRGRCDK